MKILIVEDNVASRKVMRITFEHYGCTVVEAEDGLQGLEQAASNSPDIIVSDVLMPRMDGFQLLRALKNEQELKEIPFIFYSSTYTGEREVELARSLGAEAYVVKPVEPEALWQKTCEVMKGWEAQRGVASRPAIDESNEQYLREYSRIVATKLEEKVHELEEALTLRQQAENDLKEQERELATIFDNAPFMMLLLDGERKIRRVNGIACSFTGSPAEDLAGLRGGEALHCIHALDCDEGCGFGPYCQSCVIRSTVLNTLETGQGHHQVEVHLPVVIGGNERSVVLLISTTKVMVAHQAMVLLSLQDISEYKKLEEQLHHSQRMESIGTLAGGIAHDFNNILTVIIGYGDIALMSMGSDDPQRQYVEQIKSAANKAACLARDLLQFSRKQISDKKHVDLNEIVRSVEKFLLRIIGEDIVGTITLHDSPLTLLADAHQLEQILMNFATNARDAMPNGGRLTISTELMELDETFMVAHGFGGNGAHALLTVTDTGIGMDGETLRQIFDPFFTTKEVGKGTGLGMSIVYGIVRQHEGYITASSEPGHGATFRIYLPLVAAPANETENDLNNEKPGRGAETILVAEDDESVRNMTASLLNCFGYNVIEAVDGKEAVHKFLEYRDQIRLLLFDVTMPNKNGIAAFEEIRAIAPDIKVIFSSGYAVEAVRQKAQDDEHVTCLSKPYPPTALLSMVRTVLDRVIVPT